LEIHAGGKRYLRDGYNFGPKMGDRKENEEETE
jgi:hypothetical protein